jgi:hypothetical protein
VKTLDDCVDAACSFLTSIDLAACDGDPHLIADALGLDVVEAPFLTQRRGDHAPCDGMSFLDDDVIMYAPTPSRRENFTLAHEIGHWLVNRTDAIFDWLGEQEHGPRLLETICDRIARRLLVADQTITDVLGGEPVNVTQIRALYDATQASIPVCLISLAKRLPCVGAVVDIDPVTWQVNYSSVQPDPDRGWPVVVPWPGHDVKAAHPLRQLTAGRSFQRKSWWDTSWGQREPFYIDASHTGHRILAVFAADDLWSIDTFHAPTERAYDERPTRTVTCCGQTTNVRGWPCQKCNGGYCPTCKSCNCDRKAARERPCVRCGLIFLPHLLQDGLCEECA